MLRNSHLSDRRALLFIHHIPQRNHASESKYEQMSRAVMKAMWGSSWGFLQDLLGAVVKSNDTPLRLQGEVLWFRLPHQPSDGSFAQSYPTPSLPVADVLSCSTTPLGIDVQSKSLSSQLKCTKIATTNFMGSIDSPSLPGHALQRGSEARKFAAQARTEQDPNHFRHQHQLAEPQSPIQPGRGQRIANSSSRSRMKLMKLMKQ